MQNNHNVYHLSERVSLETASFLCHRKLRHSTAKNAAFAFFLGATVVFPGEVFSSLERLRTFFIMGYDRRKRIW